MTQNNVIIRAAGLCCGCAKYYNYQTYSSHPQRERSFVETNFVQTPKGSGVTQILPEPKSASSKVTMNTCTGILAGLAL